MSIVWIHFQNIYLDKIRQSLLILEEFRSHLLLFNIELIKNSDSVSIFSSIAKANDLKELFKN